MATPTLQILIDGQDVRADANSASSTLNRVHITKELNRHSWCTVEIRQAQGQRPPMERWVGKPLVVESTAQDVSGRKLFVGFVQDVQLQFEANGSFTVVLKGVSQSYKLDLAKRRYYYGPVSISAVAEKAGGFSGVTVTAKSGGQTQPPLDLVQWSETDWHFLWRLCDDFGLYLVATDDGVKIDSGFSDSGPSLAWRSDQDTSVFAFAIRGALAPAAVDGCHYDFSASKSESYQNTSQDPSLSGAIGTLASAVTKESKSSLKSSYRFWRNRAKSVSDYETSLKNEAEWSVGSQLLCEGSSRCESLSPGQSVQINGISGAEGKYNIFRVIHSWEPSGYTNQFFCTPWMNYRSPEHPERPAIHGVYSARVVNIDDPQGQGQVQIQYYWQEQGQTTWVRHLTPYAGADRGFFFRPEVGDEVLVAFEEGDPERPMILCSAWNMCDLTPNEDFWGGETHQNDIKRIVTKSGHRLSMVDKPGEEAIGIATPVHSKIVLHEKATETGRPAILLNVDEGDIILNAPNGRIHFHSKYWSREVGK